MSATAERLEFAPPPVPGMLRAFGLAVAAHLVLLAALTWGVSWRHKSDTLSVEAELWAAVPQQAAPKLVETPPPKVVEPRPESKVANADIAVEREKKPEPKPKAEPEKPKVDPKRLAQQAKDEEDARHKEAVAEMLAKAGATGAATTTGSAQRSAAPSASYAASIRAAIGNIFYSGEGNPVTDVEFRTNPIGLITDRRIVKFSGNKAWDDAVLRTINAMERLPRNSDGVVPSPLTVGISPNR